jgi:RNA polymerase sigma-70 factor (ECF subfamily)
MHALSPGEARSRQLAARSEAFVGSLRPLPHSYRSLEEADDAFLVRRTVEGDDAFGELYRRYARRVFWFLLASTNSEEDAADLTQHVFLRALEALPRYQERGLPFGAWLFRIARNALYDFQRRCQRRAGWHHPVPLDLPSTSVGPETTAVHRETVSDVLKALAQLSAEKREMLTLRLAGDLTVSEIAAIVGKSEAAVSKQLQRTARALKEQIDEP